MTADSYDQTLDYLRTYASQDWLELSTLVVWANGITGAGSTKADIAEMTLGLAADLIADGSPPGDLVADDRGFVPWPGSADELLRRLRTELYALVERDELPEGFDICWFHRTSV